jgi:MAP3K TRAFs-binding domain/TIR domain
LATIRPLCFVLMPFGKKHSPEGGPALDFDYVYDKAICPAIVDAGMDPVRADLDTTGGLFFADVLYRLALSEYVIVDLTTLNPTVLYELGIRHALRPGVTVPIFAANTRLPFDLSLWRVSPYTLDEDNHLSDESAAVMRSMLGERLGRVRSDALAHDKPDSPVYQILNMEAPVIAQTNPVGPRVNGDPEIPARLAKARREQDRTALDAIASEFGEMDGVPQGMVIDLFLSYRALSAWESMIDFFDRMPHRLKKTALARGQLAFALNRGGKHRESERVLQDLMQEFGPDSYALALLGHVYEDLWIELRKAGDELLARAYLSRAIHSYFRGFKADMRDCYPGISALVLIEASEDAHPLRDALLTTVRFAASTRLERTDVPDYMDYATLLQLAILDDDRAAAEEALAHTLASVREVWQPEMTARSIRIIREGRKRTPPRAEWVRTIEHELRKAASPLGSLLASGRTIGEALRSSADSFGKEQLVGWLVAAAARIRQIDAEADRCAILLSSTERLAELAAKPGTTPVLEKALEDYMNALDALATHMVDSGEPVPSTPRGNRYDLFISYAFDDKALVEELKQKLEERNLRCFLAEKDIAAGKQWQDEVLQAITDSARVLLILTPRSYNREWITLEIGMALALRKMVIPALNYVTPEQMIEPVRKFNARLIETEQQRHNLIAELSDERTYGAA